MDLDTVLFELILLI